MIAQVFILLLSNITYYRDILTTNLSIFESSGTSHRENIIILCKKDS